MKTALVGILLLVSPTVLANDFCMSLYDTAVIAKQAKDSGVNKETLYDMVIRAKGKDNSKTAEDAKEIMLTVINVVYKGIETYKVYTICMEEVDSLKRNKEAVIF